MFGDVFYADTGTALSEVQLSRFSPEVSLSGLKVLKNTRASKKGVAWLHLLFRNVLIFCRGMKYKIRIKV